MRTDTVLYSSKTLGRTRYKLRPMDANRILNIIASRETEDQNIDLDLGDEPAFWSAPESSSDEEVDE